MTEIILIKNIEEECDLRLPDEFQVNDGHAAKFKSIFAFAVGSPSLILSSSANLALTGTLAFGEPTLTTTGPTSYEYTTLTSDCTLRKGVSTSFNSTATTLGVGTSDAEGHAWKAWIPFYLSDIAQGATITSATLKLTAAATDTHDGTNIKIGCDASVGTWTIPTTYAALNGRVLSISYTPRSNVRETLDVEYSFDVLSAVQEMVSRSDWQTDKGRYLAILIVNNNSGMSRDRIFWSYNKGSKRPKLVITTP